MAKSNYAMTEKQVEQLAHDTMVAASAANTGGLTYLRVLVTACQAQMGTGKPGRRKAFLLDDQLTVLENVHVRFYAAVLRGVTTEEVEPTAGLEPDEQRARSAERNRRATFARTAKSTLASFVAGGGDIRALDVPTVTKASLREAAGTETPESREAATIQRSVRSLVRVFTGRAREHPDEARTELEQVIASLQEVLDGLGGDVGTTTTTGTAVQRALVSSRVFPAPAQVHRSAA